MSAGEANLNCTYGNSTLNIAEKKRTDLPRQYFVFKNKTECKAGTMANG